MNYALLVGCSLLITTAPLKGISQGNIINLSYSNIHYNAVTGKISLRRMLSILNDQKCFNE